MLCTLARLAGSVFRQLSEGPEMRNPHAGEPFDDVRRRDRRRAARRQHPDADAVARPHDRRPASSSAGELQPAGPVPQRGAGLHDRGGQGRGPRASRSTSSATTATAGCPEPAPISAELLHEMMDVARLRGRARRVRPDAHGGDGARRRRRASGRRADATRRRAPRSPSWSSAAASRGCSPASASRKPGIPFTIIEKNAGVGGTWWENTYPGCRVDVGNHFYCYSFEPSDHWTEFFAQQPELQAYFEGVMHQATASSRTSGWRPRCSAPTWDDDVGDVVGARARAPTAPRRRSSARAVISAVGQLNRPNLPDIPGQDDVRGPVVPLGPVGPRRRPRPASASR